MARKVVGPMSTDTALSFGLEGPIELCDETGAACL